MSGAGGSSANRVVLEVREARKSFGAVNALAGVDLELRDGEVLALLGDNGAGKSTLVKAMAGVHGLDSGEILVDGTAQHFKSSADARRLGIETVFQDLAVFDNLSAKANLFLGREPARPSWLGPFGFLRERRMSEEWEHHIGNLQVSIPRGAASVGVMSGGQRQGIAVARAAAFASRVAILDEPTAALGIRESNQTLELIKRLPDEGVSVILVSHNLDHVERVADRAVVLRAGRKVGEAIPSAGKHEAIVSMIVGAASSGNSIP
jgi:ABC-type sugar transport system ATPase subunit